MQQMDRKIISLILGGGAGTRLYPLTSERSKPAVPIGGKYRLIDIPISNCLNSDLYRMFVLTQFNSASLNAHIKNTYQFDIFSRGFVDILAAEQTPESEKWYQGTADAVRQSMHHLANHEHEYILILSGDQLYQMNFREVAQFHYEQGADVTVATTPVVAEDAPGFGILKVNEDNWIESFTEKPPLDKLKGWESAVPEKFAGQGKYYLASMGIYLFNRDYLRRLFDENPDWTDFGKEFIPSAIQSGAKVASYAYDGYWTDIGTIKSFFEENIALAKPVPDFNLYSADYPIYTHPRLLPPSKIFGTEFIESVLSEGCICHAERVENSIIGIRSRIGSGTTIKRTVIMGADYYETLDEILRLQDDPDNAPIGIGEDCHIENAIIDKDARIGNGVTIIGSSDPSEIEDVETDTYQIRDGIVVLKKKAYIPAGTTIGLKVGELKD